MTAEDMLMAPSVIVSFNPQMDVQDIQAPHCEAVLVPCGLMTVSAVMGKEGWMDQEDFLQPCCSVGDPGLICPTAPIQLLNLDVCV